MSYSGIKVYYQHLITFCLLVSSPFLPLMGQSDTLVLNNGDQIVGEIKEMSRGVLTLETDYSDSDFQIEWEKIKTIKSRQLYSISLSNRQLLTNTLIRTLAPGSFFLESEDGKREAGLEEIVYIRQLEDDFWSRMSAQVDVGYSLTRANNLRQFNASAVVGYKDEHWVSTANYRQVLSSQDEAPSVRRIDGGLMADYAFRNGAFLGARLNILSNTQQNLDLRTTGVIGAGYYLARSNKLYWNAFAGPALNVENFGGISDMNVPSTSDRESIEAVVGSELNLFDIGDLSLFTNIYWYPSLTEEGRYRVDYKFDVKYDLPLDFYLQAGLTLNFDNQPAAGASESDYVIITGFGWEL